MRHGWPFSLHLRNNSLLNIRTNLFLSGNLTDIFCSRGHKILRSPQLSWWVKTKILYVLCTQVQTAPHLTALFILRVKTTLDEPRYHYKIYRISLFRILIVTFWSKNQLVYFCRPSWWFRYYWGESDLYWATKQSLLDLLQAWVSSENQYHHE